METSFSKYGAPAQDCPLPPAASQLVILRTPDATDVEKRHVRRCPVCGALYGYMASHEYMINGTEDEEVLTRLTPAESKDYLLQQVRRLEHLRRDIDNLQGAAGSLGDYIDRGRPSPAEEAEAYETMQAHRGEADRLRGALKAQVESLRRECPEILALWAGAHECVCSHYLESLPRGSDNAETSRYVARTALEGWRRLPEDGAETFLPAETVWLEGYLERLDRELGESAG